VEGPTDPELFFARPAIVQCPVASPDDAQVAEEELVRVDVAQLPYTLRESAPGAPERRFPLVVGDTSVMSVGLGAVGQVNVVINGRDGPVELGPFGPGEVVEPDLGP
jgi:hypothetical protein